MIPHKAELSVFKMHAKFVALPFTRSAASGEGAVCLPVLLQCFVKLCEVGGGEDCTVLMNTVAIIFNIY